MQAGSVKIAENTFFVICNECFWCASLLGSRPVDICPSCSRTVIGVLQPVVNERYSFDYNAATEVTLEFSPRTHGIHAA